MKRVLSFILAAAMLLSLASCAGTGNEASNDPGNEIAVPGPSGAPGPGGDDFAALVFARAKSCGENGRAESYWICEKMLVVLRQHTMT